MKRLFALAVLVTLMLWPISKVEAKEPQRCYTRMDYGVMFTKCNNGYYAHTIRKDRHKITTWRKLDTPEYKVVCRGINDKSLLPVPRCA